MKRFAILSSFVLLLFQPASAQKSAGALTGIDSALNYLHQRELFNGTVLIAEKGKVLYKKAFGVRNAQGER